MTWLCPKRGMAIVVLILINRKVYLLFSFPCVLIIESMMD